MYLEAREARAVNLNSEDCVRREEGGSEGAWLSLNQMAGTLTRGGHPSRRLIISTLFAFWISVAVLASYAMRRAEGSCRRALA